MSKSITLIVTTNHEVSDFYAEDVRETVVTALDGFPAVTNVIIDRRHPDNDRRSTFDERVRNLTDNIGRGYRDQS